MSQRRLWVVLGLATVLVVVLFALRRHDPVPQGLRANYYSGIDWTDPVRSGVDATPSGDSMALAWERRLPAQFSVIWQGWLYASSGGPRTLSLRSDDGAWLYVDEKLCAELPGHHPPQTATCTVDLARGPHAVQVRYFQGGGDLTLEVAWAAEGEALRHISSRYFSPRRVSFAHFATDVASAWALGIAEACWLLIALGCLAGLARHQLQRLYAAVRADTALRWLVVVVSVSFVLNAVGIWCGLLDNQGWFGDEIAPALVLDAIAQRFSNGWWGWYPPVHYYVLTIFYSPVLLLEALGQVDPTRGVWYDVLHAINRGVVLIEAAGIVIAVYLSGAIAFSKRAGIFAAEAFALFVPFVAYAKVGNIEVPYVFWFAISMVFYLRFVQQPTVRHVSLFALCGGLSIASKDQAFALYLCTPIVIVAVIARDRVSRGVPHPLAGAFLDARTLAAAVVVTLVFALGNNLPFNYDGMVSRLSFLSYDARMVADFDLFSLMPERRLRLLVQTATVAKESWGWPLMIAGVTGWVAALLTPGARRCVVALTVVAVSYYLFFINAVLYCYDRFLLPVAVVQALFAGFMFDRWLGPSLFTWRGALASGVFVYSLLYAGMLDALMLRDSRYAVERWLREQAAPGTSIGVNFLPRLQPRLDGFRVREFDTIEALQAGPPEFYVFDADYARAVRKDSPMGTLLSALADGTIGYDRVLEYRAPIPWGWLPGAHPQLAGRRGGGPVSSSLGDINPTFIVLKRRN